MEQLWLAVSMGAAGYALGSVPFGIVVCKWLGTVDPRTAGSRNIGFTNVLRVAGKKAGLLTLAGDLGKGWLVGWIAARSVEPEAVALAVALCPVVGHTFSAFLGFRGGKGVATALGAVIGSAPVVGLAAMAIWLLTVAVWKYSSVGALVAFGLLPVLGVVFERSWGFVGFSLILCGLIWLKHRDNLIRLWNGTEPKIGQRLTGMS
ncbi:MAG TPA: glycerol-3-phosphate 1-O-acyltransferase PlsY [Nitrospiraceae bacterium]|jgi:glycerol-3-phosphate acyltransferase PlsY|nr:glycerol-3-phosphate 1-O-acyltransferase PlsY [Nitrospiraceae bacterium]